MRVYKNVLFSFIIKFIVVFIDNELIRTWNMEHGTCGMRTILANCSLNSDNGAPWRHFFRSISFKSFLSIFILTLLTLLCLTAQSLLLPVVSISLNKIEAFPTFSASWTI